MMLIRVMWAVFWIVLALLLVVVVRLVLLLNPLETSVPAAHLIRGAGQDSS